MWWGAACRHAFHRCSSCSMDTYSDLVAAGIFVADILDAVPIDKYFELFKPGAGGEGGFIRIGMTFDKDRTSTQPNPHQIPPSRSTGTASADTSAITPFGHSSSTTSHFSVEMPIKLDTLGLVCVMLILILIHAPLDICWAVRNLTTELHCPLNAKLLLHTEPSHVQYTPHSWRRPQVTLALSVTQALTGCLGDWRLVNCS